jgi:hypothetical protein
LPLFKSNLTCNAVTPPPVSDTDKIIWNYPHPFTNNTEIFFKTQGGHILIQIFDTLGRVISNLHEKDYPISLVPVKYSVTFNAETLPTGIYYARLQNGVIQRVWPMMKVR